MEADSAGTERPFLCELCPKKYLRKNNMQDHVLMEHPDSIQASDIIEYKARNGRCKATLIIECDICAKRFRYQSDMKNHYESHFRPRGRGAKISIMGSPRGDAPTVTKSTPAAAAAAASAAAAAAAAAAVATALAASPSKSSPSSAVKAAAPGRGAPGVIRGPYQPRKSRPCLYCGRIFSDKEELRRHEIREAAEFEREAGDFDTETRSNRVNQSDFESQSERFQQLIDRTDEEFGGDSCDGGCQVSPAAGRPVPQLRHPVLAKEEVAGCTGMDHFETMSQEQQQHHQHLQHTSQHPQQNHRPGPPISYAAYNTQYNHTSQYTSLDPGVHHLVIGEPPPAHEDQISQHGFLPPPPPLPVPQFAQGCHNRGASDAEFPDPNEERTYTRLQSKDESHTCSSLLQVNSMSPSREVLDLSLPKPADGEEGEKVIATATASGEDTAAGEVSVIAEVSDTDDAIKSEAYPSSTSSCEDDQAASTILPERYNGEQQEEQLQQHQQLADSDEIVFFEPSSMPSMPEANLSCPPPVVKTAPGPEDMAGEMNGLSEEEWKAAMADDYSGLMDVEEEEEEEPEHDIGEDNYEDRSRSPHQFDDPNRIDCKFCGMIFDAPHVRKFHESSHDEELEEYDGELTRLFCGYCGKTFKKAQYRILHEKGHTGELSICCSYCDRRFRWESELRAHNRLFCTADRPAQPLGMKKVKLAPPPSLPEAKKIVPAKEARPVSNGHHRRAERDDWRHHPTLPAGWKLRSRPRPTQEGQKYFVYLSPEGQVFNSRRSVLKHMEKTGGYSREELKLMRLHCKAGPRGRRPKSLLGEENNSSNNSLDLDTSGSNLDCNDSSSNMMDLSLDNYVKDEDDVDDGDKVEGKRKKPSRSSDRKFSHKRRVNKA